MIGDCGEGGKVQCVLWRGQGKGRQTHLDELHRDDLRNLGAGRGLALEHLLEEAVRRGNRMEPSARVSGGSRALGRTGTHPTKKWLRGAEIKAPYMGICSRRAAPSAVAPATPRDSPHLDGLGSNAKLCEHAHRRTG